MSGAYSLSKIRAALIVFFVIFLLALFAQLFYILRRRQSKPDGGGDEVEVVNRNSYSSPKDPLSFFRLTNDHELGLESNTTAPPSYGNIPDLDADVLDIDLLMLQGLFGPPRFLYTIKEEREDWGSPADKSRFSASPIDEIKRSGSRIRVTLADRFKAAEDFDSDSAVEPEAAVGYVNSTPFSTPRASPLILGEVQK